MRQRQGWQRLLGAVLSVTVASAGCASLGPYSADTLAREGYREKTRDEQARQRATARRVLIGVAVGFAALAVAGGALGYHAKTSLEDDLAAGPVTGRDYADQDAAGQRWNRLARASLFAAGLSALGVGVVWEMNRGDATLNAPTPPSPTSPSSASASPASP